MPGKVRPEDFRIVEGIHLVTKALATLEEMKTKLEVLGIGYIRNKVHDDIEYLRAIMYTGANPIANSVLIESINSFDREINSEFPYPPYVKVLLIDVGASFRVAVGKHVQEYEGRQIEAISKSLGSHEVLDRPTVHFKNPYKKKNVINDV